MGAPGSGAGASRALTPGATRHCAVPSHVCSKGRPERRVSSPVSSARPQGVATHSCCGLRCVSTDTPACRTSPSDQRKLPACKTGTHSLSAEPRVAVTACICVHRGTCAPRFTLSPHMTRVLYSNSDRDNQPQELITHVTAD